jgi:ribonuclease HI
MRVDFLRPVFNLEPRYRVTMLTREEWASCPGAGVYGQSVNRRLSIPLGKHATVFQAEIYAILACVSEIETQDRPEKYVSICCDSQAALKALQAAKTTSPLVQ